MSDLTIHPLNGPQDFATLTAEWNALAGHARPRNPFVSPAWITFWWKHFQRSSFLFSDEFIAHVIRDSDGRLLALAPLMRTRCPGVGPSLMRIVQFFGTDPSLTEFRGLICRPEDHARVVAAVDTYLVANRRRWDILRWYGLPNPAHAYASSSPGSRLHARESLLDYTVELPPSWGELNARVSSNMRKNLRKAYELLHHGNVNYALRVVERTDDVREAFVRFLALHGARAEAAGMVVHPNKFKAPHTRDFLLEYLTAVARSGGLRLFELEIAGKVVATRIAFLLGPDLYVYFGGYDVAWKSYSVMTVLTAEIMKWAIAHGFERVNLSTGRDQSKLRWKPDEITLHTAVQISPTLRAKAAMGLFLAYEVLSRARDRFGR